MVSKFHTRGQTGLNYVCQIHYTVHSGLASVLEVFRRVR
jgi:hypothetical protein